MKNNFKVVLVAIFILILGITLVSCEFKNNNPEKINEFALKLNDTDNYTMIIETDVPQFGKIIMTVEKDKNKTHSSSNIMMFETYGEIVDGTYYKYSKDLSGNWTRTPQENAEETNIDFEEILNSENFEYSKKDKKFIMKDEAKINLENDEVDKLTIEFVDENCIIMAEITGDEQTSTMKIEIKNVGTTIVNLPKIIPI